MVIGLHGLWFHIIGQQKLVATWFFHMPTFQDTGRVAVCPFPAGTIGTVKVKVLPSPGVLTQLISPPWASTNFLTIFRPRPQPNCSRTASSSERKNWVNSRF